MLFNFLKTYFYFSIRNSLGQTRFLPNSYDFSHISGMAEQPQQYARCNKCLLNVFIIIQATIDMVQNSNMVHLFGAIISILHRTLNHKLIKPEPHARKNRVSQFFFFFRQCHQVACFVISKTRYRAVSGQRPAHTDSHRLTPTPPAFHTICQKSDQTPRPSVIRAGAN